ncbi:MAG: hypothetical protein ACKVHO_07360 [Verrucomicrobiia bacterium]|jgi:hypothetical protein
MESPTLKDRLRHTPFLVLLSFTLWGLVAEMSGWFQDSPRFEQVSMTICVIICVTCVVLAIGVAFAYVRHPARTYRATVVFAWSLIGWDLYGAELLYIANAEFLGALVTVILPCTLLAFRKELAGFLRIPPVSLVIPYRLLLQRAGFVLAIAATGIALFYTFENWRWKRAWNNHVSEKKAADEWFDLNVTPVPDEDVLLALSIYRDDLAQLSQGLERPFTQFLEDYEPANIRFAHLAMSKGICMVLRTRATARLEAGQLDNAVADVIDGYRIADRFTREPLLINWLVRIAGIAITHQGVWEGLRAGRWQDSHLKTIQNELARNDVFDGLSPCLRAERTLFTRTLLQSPATILDYLTPTAVTPLLFVDWAPKGWFYSSALEVSLLIDQLDMACAARTSIREFPSASTQLGT